MIEFSNSIQKHVASAHIIMYEYIHQVFTSDKTTPLYAHYVSD